MTTKADLLKNVRIFCSECNGGPRSGKRIWPVPNPSDIEACAIADCIWYPFRDAKDPKPSKVKQENMRKRVTGIKKRGRKKKVEA
jgi:hypothetical protein